MPAIHHKYKFNINHPTQGALEAKPMIDDFKLSWELANNGIYYRHKIDTKLLCLSGDYTYFKAIEEGANQCEQIDLDLQVNCYGFMSIFNGSINLKKGNWNKSKKRVDLSIDSEDKYSCLLKVIKTEKNILSNPKVSVKPFQGEIQEMECVESNQLNIGEFILSSLPNAQCVSLSDGWTLVNNKIKGVTEVASTTPQRYNATRIESLYLREFVSGSSQPPGSEWISVSGGFARPLNKTFRFDKSDYDPSNGELEQVFLVTGYDVGTKEVVEFDNGVTLENAVNLWLGDCGLTIRSDFFNINGNGSNPSNIAYTYANTFLQNLIWFQKTDIKNAGSATNASVGKINLEGILRQLKNSMDVEWDIIGNDFVLEHSTYFDGQNGMDLTVEKAEYINGYEEYDYDNDKLPQYERFGWMDEVSGFFEGEDIVYNNACINTGEEKLYIADRITTDLNYVQGNPENVDNEGFFLMSAIKNSSEYFINNNNKALALTNLHENLWRHNRPQLNGSMNNTETIFESTDKSKKQVPLKFPFCCEELILFDPTKKMKTQLGWGKIVKAEFSAKEQTLTVDLIHD